MRAGPKLMIKTPEEMAELLEKYFVGCEKNEKQPTIAGMAYACGICRRSMVNYANRDEFSPLIDMAKTRIEMMVEEKLLSGSAAGGAIFWLKNNAGYRDEYETKTEVTQKNANGLTDAELERIAAGGSTGTAGKTPSKVKSSSVH